MCLGACARNALATASADNSADESGVWAASSSKELSSSGSLFEPLPLLAVRREGGSARRECRLLRPLLLSRAAWAFLRRARRRSSRDLCLEADAVSEAWLGLFSVCSAPLVFSVLSP